ncbi:MAG: hypothetical protein ACRD8Z_08060, partial [Nitrososphaeraceae archaeon]
MTSHLLPKALKVAGGKIEIAHEQLQQYEREGGSKAILAKIASPCLGVLKKVLPPAPEKELHKALSEGGTKLKQFLCVILNDEGKRKEFEDNLKKFLTEDYGSLDEFQRIVRETMGISVDRLAIEAYSQFGSIIYNRDILNKIIILGEVAENDRGEIQENFQKLSTEFDQQLRTALAEIERILV